MRSARAAWVVCALVLALLAVGAIVEIATWSTPLPTGLVLRGVNLFIAPVFAILGALIISRVPTNAIGYLFLCASVLATAQCLVEQAAFAAEVWPPLAPVAPAAALLYYVLGLIGSLVPPLYLIALFPRGRFETRRDRFAVIVGSVAFVGALAGVVTLVERLPVPFSKYTNLWVDVELGVVRYAIGAVGTIVFIATLGIVFFGVVERFRQARGVERQQLKWFAYAAALLALAITLLWLAYFGEYLVMGQAVFDAPPVELRAVGLVVVVAFAVLPVAVAVAILRYRLYDIDFLINRTVLYVSITAILATVFALLSAAAQRGIESVTGERSDVVTAASAITVALGFAPLRRRIQPIVDHVLPGRGLLALLMTDIVGSTERVVALGDERWSALLDTYRAAVRHELARFGGHEVDTAGDGFFATFDHAAQAVRCALALRKSLRALGLDSRVGLHAGECELRGERVSGLNVVVTARIMATAGANEIVTSSALRDLVSSVGFRFHDGRVEALKGVPGEWPLSLLSEEVAPAG